jgi:PiT family inorganic phosphate transporter
MAASITVIIASQLGLPVSSTHIAVGGIFGVGFLREYLDQTEKKDIIAIEQELVDDEKKVLKALGSELKNIENRKDKKKDDYERIVDLYKMIDDEEEKVKEAKRNLKSAQKVQYVKRDAIKKIVAAWVITVPAAAILSAMVYYMIRGIVI